VNGLKNGGQR